MIIHRCCLFLTFLGLAGLVVPAPASGATIIVTPNKTEADDIVISEGDSLRAYFAAGRSYECSITQKTVNSASEHMVFDLEARDPDGESFTLSAAGHLTPRITAPNGSSALKARVSLIASKSGEHALAFLIGSGVSDAATVRCFETTLAGGFNTFFARIPILELTNTTGSDIDAIVTATDFAGTALIEDLEISVSAGSRRDVVLDAIPADRYGDIRVTFVGPRGALRGYVSEYDSASGALVLRRERPLEAPPLLP